MRLALVYLPTQIDPDIIEWLTDGWNGQPKDVLSFLYHLTALRYASTQHVDGVIIVEQGAILSPKFEVEVDRVVSKIPSEYTTCLLTHYVTDWSGVQYIESTDNLLAIPTDHVLGSFAYWIRMDHVERLLAIYDQPLRYIPSFTFNPEKISRSGRVCMVCTPLVARLDQPRFQEYYSVYGF